MNREQMVQRLGTVLAGQVDGPVDELAAMVLNAILPQVSTVAELEALFRSVSENAEPAVVISAGRPFILTEDDYGDVWAWSYIMEDENRSSRLADSLTLPLTVVWQP